MAMTFYVSCTLLNKFHLLYSLMSYVFSSAFVTLSFVYKVGYISFYWIQK